jgi:uncharacterized protein involved in exopolysaccharide biosynthesis
MNPPPLSSPPAKPSSRGCLLYAGIVIVTFLLVFFSACVVTYVMPKKYESTAVIQVMPSQRAIDSVNNGNASTPQFFATEFEVITSTMTLKPVVQRLDLTTRWNMTEEEAVAMLKQLTIVNRIQGTDLIEITVKHTNPEEARDIAREIYLSYKKRREDKERDMVENALKELEKAILDQSDVVEEKRKQRDNLLKRDSNSPEMEQTKQDVQKEYEVQQEMLDRMKEKLAMDRLNAKVQNLIEMHEEPLVAQFPSSPNVTLNLLIGAAAGLFLGVLLALIVRLFVGRRVS